MHCRYEGENIPIEILRTLVTISEGGTFARAAARLKLGQPAVTAQMKRLQLLVGGPIFHRESGALALTELGALVLEHARRIVAQNDQILLLGGRKDGASIRLGLSTFYADALMSRWQRTSPGLQIVSDCSGELLKRMSEGQLSIACCVGTPPLASRIEAVDIWDEPFAWVRSPGFFLKHDEPIPIIARAGSSPEHPMILALECADIVYRIVFTSPDLHARMAAVSAGLGLCAIPKRLVPPALVVASDRALPPLPAVWGAIYRHRDAPRKDSERIIDWLRTFRPENEVASKLKKLRLR
jgi:DNA-binding transcriptional LysR family regulator